MSVAPQRAVTASFEYNSVGDARHNGGIAASMKIMTFDEKAAEELPTAELSAALKSTAHTIWVDMTGPTDEDIRVMHDVFQFHQLAIEDTRNQRQRPKIEDYND